MSIRSEISWDWKKRADLAIAHGALTNSKRPETFVKGVYPTHLKRGQGGFVWDDAGKRYVDFIGGLGSCLLGYAAGEITDAVTQALRDGSSLSLSSTLEVETAEKLKECLPFVDQVRFLKTGSEACSAALRIARASTGRLGVLSHGYHGWHDEFVSLTPPATGVPRTFEYIGALESSTPDLDGVGAVIIEPILTDYSERRREFLQTLREHCTKHGTLLIFDEIITGFRIPGFTVAKHWGIEPDLICLGKAIAGGLPLSVVGGKKQVMESAYFVSSTFAGERVSLAAAKKTIELLLTEKYSLKELWGQGEKFQNRFNALWPECLKIKGYPTRGVFEGDHETKALFWQEACEAGLLFGPSFFFHFGHIGQEDLVLSTCQDIVGRLKTKEVKLKGELPHSPFAQKMRT
jgi:glutamate-1-semialdehyde 2,1-aminomutase